MNRNRHIELEWRADCKAGRNRHAPIHRTPVMTPAIRKKVQRARRRNRYSNTTSMMLDAQLVALAIVGVFYTAAALGAI